MRPPGVRGTRSTPAATAARTGNRGVGLNAWGLQRHPHHPCHPQARVREAPTQAATPAHPKWG